MQSGDRKGSIYMAAAALCWSFGGLCIKFVPWSAMSIIGLRAVLAAAVFVAYRRSFKVHITTGNILAALCLSSTTITFVFANKLTTAAAAIFLQFSAPIFIILIQFVFYKKKPRLSEIIAMAATFAGMLLFFADQLESGGLLGNLFAIASGISFAGVFVCNSRQDTDSDHSLLIGFIINAAIGLPFAFFEATADPIAWASIVFLGIVQVGLAYVFFSLGIKRTPALLACLTTVIEPVLSPIWVAIFMREAPGIFVVTGGAVIIVTVIAYNIWSERHPTVGIVKPGLLQNK